MGSDDQGDAEGPEARGSADQFQTLPREQDAQSLRCSSHPSTLLHTETVLFQEAGNLNFSKQLRSGACHLSFDSGDSKPNYAKRCGRVGEHGSDFSRHISSSRA